MRLGMKRFFYIALIYIQAFFSCNLYAHDLEGEWIVDVGQTLEFNKNNLRLSKTRFLLLDCVARNTKLFFSVDTMLFEIKDHDCEKESVKHRIEGMINKSTYDVIYESNNQSVLKLTYDYDEDLETIEVINWINSNYFWIYDEAENQLLRFYYMKK